MDSHYIIKYRRDDMTKRLYSIKDIRQYYDSEATLGLHRSVTDRNDKIGKKAKYITWLRDRAVLNELSNTKSSSRILDLGCGSGYLSKALDSAGYRVTGVDISLEIIKLTQHHAFRNPCIFAQYDGQSLPFRANCFDACVISKVLCHLHESNSLHQILKEVTRVLKPGGRLIAVEPTRHRRKFYKSNMTLQRPAADFLKAFEEPGLVNKSQQIIRRGHFPLIYPIRYGFIPSLFFPCIGRIEVFLGSVFSRPLLDYVDTVFVAEKPSD